jgi:peroxiredoxin
VRTVHRAGLAVLLAAASLSPVLAVRYGLALAPGDAAPSIKLPAVAGATYRHGYADHAFTIVNFWATWCRPCREEMTALQRLADEHRDDGLAVVGILLDRADDAQARRFLDEVGARYPALRGNIETMQAWGGIGMFPTTFLIDREGKIVRRYVGASPAQIEGLRQDVASVLAGRPLGSMMLAAPEPPRED